MFKHVLIATDCHDGLERFARCLEALQTGGIQQASYIHSLDWKEESGGIPDDRAAEIEAIEAKLRDSAGVIPAGMSFQVGVQVSKPSVAIQNAIREYQPDVLILGMSTRNFLAEKLFGSTTMELLPKLSIPVLVVRPQMIATFTLEELRLRCRHLFRCVLLPYDFSESSGDLLNYLVNRLAQADPASPSDPQIGPQIAMLHLLHVVDPSSRINQNRDLPEIQAKADKQLDQIEAAMGSRLSQTRIEGIVRTGSPVKEILQAASDLDMTAIALVSRHAGRFWEWSVASVTGEILRQSWHSVLFFPPDNLRETP